MSKDHSTLYRLIRPTLVRLYHRYSIFSKLRTKLENLYLQYFRQPNHEIVNELKALIDKAKAQNQPIFVQFPVLEWDVALFQRPQQISIAMAEIGYLVIYLEMHLLRKRALRKLSDNLYITDQDSILKYLDSAVVSVYLNFRPDYLKHYLTKGFMQKNSVFYEHVDHIDQQIWGVAMAKILHHRLKQLEKAPISFIAVTGKVLYDELSETYNKDKIAYIPNGVDLKVFTGEKPKDTDIELPGRLKLAIEEKKKIIGYYGAIAPWIWNEIVVELASKRSEYFILMIGPHYGDTPHFPESDNIYCMGAVPHHTLPSYTQYFDVSIIPFKLGDIAKSTSPLKLFEYFAIGKPVVVTSDLIECTKFEGVESASNVKEFIEKIDKVIQYDAKEKQSLAKKYKSYAIDNSWIMRAKQIDQAIKNR